jgi:iron only hydrogenase large subunit-like protein
MDSRFGVTEKPIPIDNRSLVLYNPHKCILCRRCDAVCREALGIDALGLVGKGPEIVISTPKNVGFDSNGCIRCGQCVTSCSCGSLVTGSCIEQLLKDLKEKTGMKIAIDSIALSSYVEKNLFLNEVEPARTERYIIGALKEAGFDKVIQYDRYILESIAKDTKESDPANKKMLSWCKAAFNYVQDRIPDSKIARSEENSPWTMLLEEEKDGQVCLVSSCTALKGVTGFEHVLSAMELDELFKQLEINPEFATPGDYERRVNVGRDHPGFGPVEKIVEANVTSLRISKDIVAQIEKVTSGYLDLFPCLARCLTGGGNYPTIKSAIIEARANWLESLWGVQV